MIRVHQVLATLGYGDAIGHEVLGIQRVLRAAGYDSEIFVEPADSRDVGEPVPQGHGGTPQPGKIEVAAGFPLNSTRKGGKGQISV